MEHIFSWVRAPQTYPRLSGVWLNNEAWTCLVQMIKENLKETDCATIQQMIEARPGKRHGEDVKYALEEHWKR